MYITNPLGSGDKKSGGIFAGLFDTHPPLDDRIKRLRDMDLGQ